MPINNSLTFTMPSAFSSAATCTQLTNTLSTTASSIAGNTNRKGLTIFNTLSVAVYVDTANTVTSSDFWFKLDAGAYYEMPEPIYTGALHMICASGTGSVEIRELS